MLNQDVLKAMGVVVKGVFKVAGTIAVAGVALAKAYDKRYYTSYNDAVRVIMNSSMWSEDKVKAISALYANAKPELYMAVIKVVESSMWSSDKVKVIIEMCKKGGES